MQRIYLAKYTKEYGGAGHGYSTGVFQVQVDMSRIGSGLLANKNVGLILDNNTTFGQGSGTEKVYAPVAGYSLIGGLLTFVVPYSNLPVGGVAFLAIGVTATPLPVHLLSFTAEKRKQVFLLRWATGNE